MPGRWDRSTKRLIGENPSHFIRWLLPEAEFQGSPVQKTTTMAPPEFDADSLFQILLFGISCLVHIEFQSYADENMAERMWKYNMAATLTYDMPTISFVVFLRRCQTPEPFYKRDFPTGHKLHHFWFSVIKLWELSVEQIKQTGLVGIFPLMLLVNDGKRTEVVEEVIHQVEVSGNESTKELLALTYILASMVFENDTDRYWLKRRFSVIHNALSDAWAYKEIMQEGWEEGIKEGMKEGLQQGLQQGRQTELQKELQAQRLILLEIVHHRFPDLEVLAKEKVESIEITEALRRLMLAVSTASTEEQARQAFL